MARAAKIALVSINGKSYPANPEGTELELGGYELEPVAADLNPKAAVSRTPVASKLTFQPIAREDFDPFELNVTEGADIVIEYDNGAKYKMPDADCSKPGSKGGSDTHWTFEFIGAPCEPT